MTSLYEFGKALPDQVTSERLSEARSRLAAIQELDPSSIDAVTLAEQLQGVSRAVSDIALARGAVEVTRLTGAPDYDPAIMPEVATGNILRHFDTPGVQTGRMFTAQPSKGYGAVMAVHEVTPNDQRFLYEVHIPTDQMLDGVLMQEPALWDNMSAFAQDFRSGQSVQAYPFHARFYDERAPARYLNTLQELSAELLTVSGQE